MFLTKKGVVKIGKNGCLYFIVAVINILEYSVVNVAISNNILDEIDSNKNKYY